MNNSNTLENLENELEIIHSDIKKTKLDYQSKSRFLYRRKDDIEDQIRLIKGIPKEFKEYFNYLMFSPRDVFNGFLLEARVYKFYSKEELLDFLKRQRKLSNIMAFYSYVVDQYDNMNYYDVHTNKFVYKTVKKYNIRFASLKNND